MIDGFDLNIVYQYYNNTILNNIKGKLRIEGVLVSGVNPVGSIFSGASVLCCTPNALATGGYALGTIATDDVLAEVVRKAGFSRFTRATETPVNRIFEIRK